jgi:hypothetical protein
MLVYFSGGFLGMSWALVASRVLIFLGMRGVLFLNKLSFFRRLLRLVLRVGLPGGARLVGLRVSLF